jgi:hypothetical protein
MKHIFLLLLFACPMTAFAHGEDVLTTIFLELIVVVIFVVALLTVRLNGKGKLIIGGIYISTTALTFMITNGLPYNQYQATINIIVGAVPLTIGLISYLILRNKFQKE